MKIRHNLLAMDADNFLGISTKKKGEITEKLSSGQRINRAGDDAAGLAISEKMRSQIRGLNQGSRNTQDGISLIQTAEGSLNEVHEMLQRMNKLSVQASNGTNSDEDRELIQKEIGELVKEVDNISNNTEFNGMKLLDGTAADEITNNTSTPLSEVNENGEMKLQDLLNNDSGNLNIIFMDGDNFETTKSASGNSTVAGYTYLKNVLQTQIVPQAVTSVLKSFSPALNYLSSSSIGIGLNLYSDAASTTLASVSVGFSTSGGNVNSSMLAYKLSVNMASLSYDGNGQLTAASRSALETTIVHEMVHGFMDEALTNGMIGITNGVYDTRYTGTQGDYTKSSNSFPSWFKEGMAQTAAGGYANCNDWVNSGLGINTSTSQASITAIVKNISNSLSSGTTSSKYGTGYLACMYLGYLASGSSSVTAENISNGLGKILSDLGSGKSLETVISERTSGKYTGLSNFESKFGDADSSSFIYSLTQVVGNIGNGGLATGNLTDSDILPDIAATTSLFSLDTTNDTITNIYPSGVNVLSGGGATTGGTAPVNDYGTTISDPGPVINPGSTIDLSNISSIAGINYDSVNKVLTITDSGDYTLKGINTTGVRVVVNSGVAANITLDNAKINTANGSGISLEGNANVTLNLVGTNSVISSSRYAAGIRVTTGATLTIQGNGTLDAESTYNGGFDGDGAGIGGADGEDAGTIIINGGTVTAETSQQYGAGIGGGRNGNGGNITINGGNVTAKAGGHGGAGIGGGVGKDGGNITINGGNVVALGKGITDDTGVSCGAGIGGGQSANGGNITINGGEIAAQGGNLGAGIGGGTSGDGGTIIITGGNITAKGGKYATGIGGGITGDGGSITISGGAITAEGGNAAAGIGGGLYGEGGNVDINGEGVIVKATSGSPNASNIGGGGLNSVGGTAVSGGTVTKTQGIIFEGTSGKVYGDITLNGPLNCDGKTLTVLGGSTLTVLNGGTITNHGTFTNNGRIENYGAIGSVSGPGVTHHYVSGISKHIKEPTTATIGKSLAESISQFSPSTISVAYNGTTRALTGTWSVKDKDGNSISDLSGTIVGDNEDFTYTVTFASEDGIYFDPSNMSIYSMERTNGDASKSQIVSDEYVSASGPSGGGSTLSYSYVVASALASAVPDPAVPDPNEAGGIKIQVGDKANQTITITIESVKSDDLGIKDLSVLTQDDAKKAIDSCYKAINKVSEIRGKLGAYQNRLEHTMLSIDNTEENLQNAESRIRDMDMAKGMMEYSKYEILIHAGQAMLAQTNQEPKDILALLA